MSRRDVPEAVFHPIRPAFSGQKSKGVRHHLRCLALRGGGGFRPAPALGQSLDGRGGCGLGRAAILHPARHGGALARQTVGRGRLDGDRHGGWTKRHRHRKPGEDFKSRLRRQGHGHSGRGFSGVEHQNRWPRAHARPRGHLHFP